MNPSPRRNTHEPAYQRLHNRWGWLFGRQSRVEREAAMAEFAEMPEELRQFVLAECAYAQVQATEELRATMLQAFKVALTAQPVGDGVDGAEVDDEVVDEGEIVEPPSAA